MLFINLNDEDWPDLGIVNKVHVRKLQLILKSYRYRYQQFKDKVEVDEDDDLVSEYSPSELSAMIRAEDVDYDDSETEDDSQVFVQYNIAYHIPIEYRCNATDSVFCTVQKKYGFVNTFLSNV